MAPIAEDMALPVAVIARLFRLMLISYNSFSVKKKKNAAFPDRISVLGGIVI
jgi:hypothetical protein